MVHDTAAFLKHVIPQYFNQTKYKSFQRQLSLYGFTRVATGRRKGLCLHEKLLRGQRGLCRSMKPITKENQFPSSPPRSPRSHSTPSTTGLFPKVVSQGDIQSRQEPSTPSPSSCLDENKIDKATAETHSGSPKMSPISVEDSAFFEGKSFFLVGAAPPPPQFTEDGVHYQEEQVAPIIPQPLLRAPTFPSLAPSKTVMSDDVKAQLRKAWERALQRHHSQSLPQELHCQYSRDTSSIFDAHFHPINF